MSASTELTVERQTLISKALRTYDLARTYLSACASVDEVAPIADAAARMAAYARVIEDKELEAWVSEIRCRAALKLGHESKRLPTLVGGRPETLPAGGKSSLEGSVQSKADILRAAGISTSAAHRYEQLASADEENPTAAEAYYEECKAKGVPPTQGGMTQAMKRDRRGAREQELADKIEDATMTLGVQRYGAILADPPWRFEPRSRVTGMDRSADNHYPTMTLGEIRELDVPAADDCALFLWATAPMLPEALETMADWGFEYKTSMVWVKDRIGTGYWARSRHELLLIGTKGEVPAPAPGDQFESVFQAPVAEHSRKPAQVADMVASMFPHLPKLEMFARCARPGWDSWGAEAEVPDSER